jgi:GT2 family glycosyltransferase
MDQITDKPQAQQSSAAAQSRDAYPSAVTLGRSNVGLAVPLVTVNILAYNRREELRTTLGKVTGELTYPADRLEIIVTDNASTDGTSDMLAREFPHVTLIRNERNEGIAGWNRGFERGRGDYFLVLDDDCYITGDALQRSVRAAQEQHADLVSFEVTTPLKEGFYWSREYDLGLLGFWGCAALISRRAIERLRGFDPNIFVWAHEVEFTIRLLDAGLKHLFLPSITAYHLKVPGTADILNLPMHRRNQRHLAYGVGKLLRLPEAISTIGNFVMRVIIWAYHYRSVAALVLIVDTVAGFVHGLRHRQPVRRRTSVLYKRNFVEYANPLLFVRSPKRAAGYRTSRSRYYPRQEGSLQLDPA